MQDGSRIGGMSTELDTSSDAPLFLRMNGRTNRVTLSSQGLRSATVTYIYGGGTLEIVSGNGQQGAAGGAT